MTPAKDCPLVPACLEGNGIQGANANTQASGYGAEHSPQQATALTLALSSIGAARAQLDRYALATDSPAGGAVEAADLLDAARVMLAQALTP